MSIHGRKTLFGLSWKKAVFCLRTHMLSPFLLGSRCPADDKVWSMNFYMCPSTYYFEVYVKLGLDTCLTAEVEAVFCFPGVGCSTHFLDCETGLCSDHRRLFAVLPAPSVGVRTGGAG